MRYTPPPALKGGPYPFLPADSEDGKRIAAEQRKLIAEQEREGGERDADLRPSDLPPDNG